MTDTVILADPAAFLRAMRASFRKGTTGVDATVFIMTKPDSLYAPQIEVAVDPVDALDPLAGETATVSFDGAAIGAIPAGLLIQARRFIEINRAALLDYWNYKIATDEMQRRLRSI
jgi:hypothetical protein